MVRTMAIAGLIASTALAASAVAAQTLRILQTPSSPLVLDSVGSFYVGGRTVTRTATEIGLYDGGPMVVDQMYVQYMVPLGHTKLPVVLIHGGTLSGKSYETTPDGRMGWYEYFARKGFPTYVIDQIGRARSGFDAAPFNRVRASISEPSSQPVIRRIATGRALVRFRIADEQGHPFADTQFPVGAAAELANQTVPDLYEALPVPNPNFAALGELSESLKKAILIGHSQGGQYPFEAALLKPAHVGAIVSIEPAGCRATSFTNADIATLAKIPILILFGDHIDAPQKVGLVQWTDAFSDCEAFVRRVKSAGGNATFVHLPDKGIRGNSHMMMQDRNNLQVADLIIGWIRRTTK